MNKHVRIASLQGTNPSAHHWNLRLAVFTGLAIASLWLAACSQTAPNPAAETSSQPEAEEAAVVPGTVLTETEYGKIIAMEGGIQVEIKQTPVIGERTPADREASIQAIRRLVGKPDLAVEYVGPGRHLENSLMAVEEYRSPDVTCLVEAPSNQVVYYQTTGSYPPAGEPLAPEELERRARQLLTENNPCFVQAEALLQYLPGGKGENSFFRWQRATPNPDNPWDQPTFIQVGIRQDGWIFSYIDSGICGLVAPAAP
ncbi:MAG: hypothetical protein PHS96_03305 [Anaerolineales bacterium]|nr:hypothetical protein [Anaerolineales bacterium]